MKGKAVIVTGGAMGIGFAIAEDLAARGAALIIADRAGARDAANRLQQAGHQAIGIDVDVADETAVQAMAENAEAAFGHVDALVNNAGIYSTLQPKNFEDIDLAEFRRVLDVNVIGVFLCTRALVPAFVRQGGGRVVNISSGVAFKGNPLMAHYVASKGAVISLTRALATELGGRNILVNSVAPGFTLSDGVNANPALVAGVKGPSLRNRILARDMTANDLVGAVAFFVGADASFVTGQTLVVDGGAYYH
jgi:NAD(P)-dependent dehydrogenase (short-subunit alcohol dehydrogenase family)